MNYITNEEIELYMEQNAKYFEVTEIGQLKNIIATSNVTYEELSTVNFKSPSTAKILSYALGWCGIDRFYAGSYVLGAVKLFTGSLYGILWIVDWFLIDKAVKMNNFKKLSSFLNGNDHASSFSNINTDTVKRVIKSKEVRDGVRDIAKSLKDVTDTLDM